MQKTVNVLTCIHVRKLLIMIVAVFMLNKQEAITGAEINLPDSG